LRLKDAFDNEVNDKLENEYDEQWLLNMFALLGWYNNREDSRQN
jgi:hypothetical protein